MVLCAHCHRKYILIFISCKFQRHRQCNKVNKSKYSQLDEDSRTKNMVLRPQVKRRRRRRRRRRRKKRKEEEEKEREGEGEEGEEEEEGEGE